MSESPPYFAQSKLLREAQLKIKQLEEEIAFLQKELEDLQKEKDGEITEYYYILDADERVLTGFFKKKMPENS
jgi:vacuolar-type H+-ATPase subunit I/STV1